jgi:hypothetical protein
MVVITRASCAASTCHTADLGGSTAPSPGTMTYARNITPDGVTGIGAWTDAEIDAAVRTGVDAGGADLCAVMPRFPAITRQEMADLIALLRATPTVMREIPRSVCP